MKLHSKIMNSSIIIRPDDDETGENWPFLELHCQEILYGDNSTWFKALSVGHLM